MTLAAATPTALAGGAVAAEFCVTCTEPDASYTCEVRGLNPQAAAGMQGQMLCIKSLAAESSHKTCGVNRNTSAACSGPVRVVSAPDQAAVPPAIALKPSSDTAIAAVPANTPAGKPSKGPFEAAGQGLTEAAKKSWSCVSSLFKDC